jgi:cytochrome c biogenesis protein CcmG, thiol:disulfide interchange protein DsbE
MPIRSRTNATRALFACVLIALFFLSWTQRNRFTPVAEGGVAPDYAAKSLNGQPFSLSAMRGRVVVLNVWATWCTPCRVEMPALQRLHERLGSQGLEVVAVSTDDDASIVKPFADELGLTFRIVHDAKRKFEDVYQVQGLPTTFVIDKHGRIIKKELGARAWDDSVHVALIERLLRAS